MNDQEELKDLIDEFRGWCFNPELEGKSVEEGYDIVDGCRLGAATLADHIVNQWEGCFQCEGEIVYLYIGPFRVALPSGEVLDKLKDSPDSFLDAKKEYLSMCPW